MWRALLLVLGGCTALASVGTSTSPSSSSESTDTRQRPDPSYETPGPVADIFMRVANHPAAVADGVDGDHPRTYADGVKTYTRWIVKHEDVPCDADHDHCLPAIAWMLVYDHETYPVRTAVPVAFTPDGPATPRESAAVTYLGDNPFTAYRTVPATQANLAVGALAAAVPYPHAIPDDNVAAFDRWELGTVERVDWDMGFVYFAGSENPRFISGTRVAVLSYRPGSPIASLAR